MSTEYASPPTQVSVTRCTTALLLTLAILTCGCDDPSKTIQALHQRVDQLDADLNQCTQQLADRDARIATLRRRINTEAHLEGITLNDLFVVGRIEILSRSGGADYDGQPGDDGVTVYIRPLDADGDVLKAAGQFTIQLTDLTVPGSPREIGLYVFDDFDALRKCWYGGLLTYHYTFKCPFTRETFPSPARELNVRVTFLDWLTGEESVASRVVAVDYPEQQNALVPHRKDG